MIIYPKAPWYEYWHEARIHIWIDIGWAIWNWFHRMRRGQDELEDKRQEEYEQLKTAQGNQNAQKVIIEDRKWN